MSDTHGHVFRVGRQWYIDAAMLRHLARRMTVEPMAGGFQVLMASAVLRCNAHEGAPLPGQAGALYTCRQTDGRDPGANLQFAAGPASGQWEEWPRHTPAAAAGCGCKHPPEAPATASGATAPCACKLRSQPAPAVVDDVERACVNCGSALLDEGHGEECPNGCDPYTRETDPSHDTDTGLSLAESTRTLAETLDGVLDLLDALSPGLRGGLPEHTVAQTEFALEALRRISTTIRKAGQGDRRQSLLLDLQRAVTETRESFETGEHT